MKARIIRLVDGRYLLQIKENFFSPWQAADRNGEYLWGSRAQYHYAICDTEEKAIKALAKFGVTSKEFFGTDVAPGLENKHNLKLDV